MAQFSWDKEESMPQNEGNGGSKGSFLKLEADGQKARVRFLASSLDDIGLHSTHRVHVKTNMGKEWDRAVECLRTDGGQPVSACPFCEKGLAIKNEIYMQVFNEDTKETQIFTRPKSFAEQLRTVFNTIQRFGNGAPVASALVEITRHGAKGNKDTNYTAEVIEFTQGVTLETLKEQYGAYKRDIHEIGCLRNVTWQEANEWARTGSLPAPAKEKVDAYGRPLAPAQAPQAPAPQVYRNEPAPQAPQAAVADQYGVIHQPVAPAPIPQQPAQPQAAPQPAPQPVAPQQAEPEQERPTGRRRHPRF